MREQTGPEIRLVLPEPPALNEMIRLAKQRTRRSRTGGFMKRSLPVVYDQALEAYQLQCLAAMRLQGIRPPGEPWRTWRLESADFRLHQLRDPIELLAGLKWPIDFLVSERFVEDDGPKYLTGIPLPTQTIDRDARGVTLVISGVS